MEPTLAEGGGEEARKHLPAGHARQVTCQQQLPQSVQTIHLLTRAFGPAYAMSSVFQLFYTFLQLATPQVGDQSTVSSLDSTAHFLPS